MADTIVEDDSVRDGGSLQAGSEDWHPIVDEEEFAEAHLDAIDALRRISEPFITDISDIPHLRTVIDTDNRRFTDTRSFRRYERSWLSTPELAENGLEFVEYGDRNWPTAVVFPYCFTGGTHKALLNRTRLIFDLTQSWGLVDEDGVPLRVIGIPTPAWGITQGSKLGMPLKEQLRIVYESRKASAEDVHLPLVDHILTGLGQIGVQRAIFAGYSDGGLTSILVSDQATETLDVIADSSGNQPGNGQSHRWLPVAMKHSLGRLRQPGNSNEHIAQADSRVLDYLVRRDSRVGHGLGTARLVLKTMAPDNLVKWAVLSRESARRPLERLLQNGVDVNFVITDQDRVCYPERLATWLPDLSERYPNLRVRMGEGRHDVCSGIGYLASLVTMAVVPAVDTGRLHADDVEPSEWAAFATPRGEE
jgi:hypothetical protein